MLEIHTYITSTFRYNTNGLESSRVLPGIFNNQEIVCSGYASLVKAIIDKLGMPELECDLVACKFVDEHNEIMESHCHNLVKIRDKKYGIDGYYVEDACWDSKNESYPNGKGIANFMYPVEDLIHYKGLGFDQFHSKVDNLFKMVGLGNRKLDPYSLPIISENIDKSTPIESKKYEECLTNLFKKMNPEETKENIEEKVASVMKLTHLTAYLIFNEKAIGSIAKYANETIKGYVTEESDEFDKNLVIEETEENIRGME